MRKCIFIIAACLFTITNLGCATVKPNARAEKDGEPEWLEDLKAMGGIGGAFGMSRESRAIEKSLAGQQGG